MKKLITLGLAGIMVLGSVASVFATSINIQGTSIGYNKTFYSNKPGVWKSSNTDYLTVNAAYNS